MPQPCQHEFVMSPALLWMWSFFLTLPITWSISNYVAFCQGVFPIQSFLHVTQVPDGALAWREKKRQLPLNHLPGAYALNCHLLHSTKSNLSTYSAVLEDVRNKVLFSKPILCMVSALAKPPTPSSRKTGTWHPCDIIQRSHRAVPEGL